MHKSPRKWLLPIVCGLLTTPAQAQLPEQATGHCAAYHQHRQQPKAKTTVASPLEDQYDVSYVKMDLAMTNQNTSVTGHVQTRAKVTAASMGSYVFELDAQHTIDSVKVNGAAVTLSSAGNVRTATLAASLTTGSSFTADVYYHGQPAPSPLGIGGINNLTSGSWGAKVTFTLSQPFAAHEWWPCKQSLQDKIDSADIWITVPAGLKAGSNGVLQQVTPLSGGRQRYEWKNRSAIDYYLLSATVGPYIDYSYHVTFPGTTDSVLVQNYLYDNPAVLPFWKNAIDTTGLMLKLFSNQFGRYPFWKEKYGHCMAPFPGGMEHQTMTTLGNFSATLVAHELGHQWFGDHVTCGTWRDIWLNEGFASYSEFLYLEGLKSYSAALTHIIQAQNRVMYNGSTGALLPDGAIYLSDTSDSENIFDTRITYDKGAAIVHTLRFVAGDAAFFQILKNYQQQYAFKTATIEDFKDVTEQVLNRSMDTFFTQWIYKEGFPVYQLKWNQVGGMVHASLQQSSAKPSSVPFFYTPLELLFSAPTGDTIIRIYNDRPVQNLSFAWGHAVNSAYVDPGRWILKHVASVDKDPGLLSVAQPTALSAVRVLPNPASHTWSLSGVSEKVRWQLTDLSGRVLAQGQCRGSKEDISAAALPTGMYLLQLRNTDHASVTLKLIKQ